MKIHHLFLIAGLFVSIHSNGQIFGNPDPAPVLNYAYDSPEMTGLKNSTLYIIPTGDIAFDDSMKVAFARYWKICPAKMLSQGDVEKYINDGSKYLVAPLNCYNRFAGIYYSSPRDKKECNRLYIFMGSKYVEKKGFIQYPGTAEICSAPFIIYNNDKSKIDLISVGFAVNEMNQEIDLVNTKQIKPVFTKLTPNTAIKDGLSANVGNLKDKTLLIEQCTAKDCIKSDAMSNYTLKYKVVDHDEILSLLTKDPGSYCVLSTETPAPAVVVYDGASKNIIYSGAEIHTTLTGGKVSEQQIADLNNAVGGK